MTVPSIPLVDLKLLHRRIATEVTRTVARVMQDCDFVLGAAVTGFESEFARYCGVEHVVGTANGTDAIELALRSVGVRVGDEVVIPANTFVATAEAVVRAGARPVLVDCDEEGLINVEQVADAISRQTTAVIPVHLYGQAARVEDLLLVAGQNIAVVEDAAQAQGAARHGRRVGGLGAAAATSFYPGKNLGAYGDAGAVMTNSQSAADAVRALRNHGGVRKYDHQLVGTNSRLDTIQAAILSVKLRVLDAWNKERQLAASVYHDMLRDVDVEIPRVIDGNDHVWHLYVVRLDRRDAVHNAMNSAGIGVGIHYPIPIHQLPAFQYLGYSAGAFPTAERIADRILSLPIFPGITVEQQVRVVDALKWALR